MGDIINIKSVISAVAFSFIGIFIFIIGFYIIDLITPKVQVGKEIVDKQNIAVAIMLGAAAIGIAQIIAAAIHG
jgi:putative membrane protein